MCVGAWSLCGFIKDSDIKAATVLCHETTVRGWTRLESAGIPGVERGIALFAWMAFD